MTREERNNAIKVIRNFDLNNPKVNSLLFSAEEITNAFDMAIKALEQELKTGHWILKRTFPTKLYDEYLNEYKCSECYREIRCSESQLVNYPYCHCGAKMIEPQESEEV